MPPRWLVFFLTAWPTIACSCASYEPAKACQMYETTDVIFRGRVIDHNDDRARGFNQMTLYRFRVIEAFKGLPPATREVFINPASLSDCYVRFQTDRDYLMYAGPARLNAALFTTWRPAPNMPAKPIPTEWNGLESYPVYGVGGCNATRTVAADDDDLAYLRSLSKPSADASGWIEGRVVQNFSDLYLASEFVAAVDTTVTVVSPSGRQWSVPVKQDGHFKLAFVPPGNYSISVESPILGSGEATSPNVEVPPRGCAVANASFETGSTISGKILDADGNPAPKVRVELGELQADGKVRVIPRTWSDTDTAGNFTISNVPVGRIVMAANLNGSPTTGMPFDTVYLPGTQDLSAAQILAIGPGEEIKDVSLRLPVPLPFGRLYVDVKWQNGSPAYGARAFANWDGHRAAFKEAPGTTNRVTLPLPLGRSYEVRVDGMEYQPGRRFLRVEGEAAQAVHFLRDGQTIELRLKSLSQESPSSHLTR